MMGGIDVGHEYVQHAGRRNPTPGDPYFALVVADGPWEARFIFCGMTGANPSEVKVDPTYRSDGQEYVCSRPDPRTSEELWETLEKSIYGIPVVLIPVSPDYQPSRWIRGER
jgi:hypothetical protein